MKNPNTEGYNALFTRIDQIHAHPAALKKELIEVSSIETMNPDELFVKPGETSRYCYFITDGFVRLYHDYKRKEVTTWFLYTGDFMIQQQGFYFGQKSHEYLQATEKTTCIKLHVDELTRLRKKYPIFTETYLILTQLYYFQLTQRDGRKAYKAIDRYRKLQEEHPYIIKMAKGAHVASYLGISEFHLSKIRNNRV